MSVAWFDGATLKIELGFGSTPYTDPGAISWTDVSADVRAVNGISINYGRSAERDTFNPGSMTLTFDNRDRDYDPDYAAGPNYGDLLPGVPIRFNLSYAGDNGYLFYGFVGGWPQAWEPSDNDSTVTVTAFDALKYLNTTRLPETVWAGEVDYMATQPAAWWRLGDDTGAALARDAIGTNHATYGTIGTLGASLIYAGTEGARHVATQDAWSTAPVLSSVYNVGSSSAYTINMWVTAPTTHTSATSQWLWIQGQSGVSWANAGGPGESIPNPPSSPYLMLELDGAVDRFKFEIHDGTNTGTGYCSATIWDDTPHMLTFVRESGTAQPKLYIDGAVQTLTTGGSFATGSVNFGSVITAGIFRGEAYKIDELAVWAAGLNSTTLASLYTAGSTGHAGDTFDERVDRIIAMSPFLNMLTAGFSGVITMQGCDFGGGSTTIGTYLQTLGQTENGRVFVSGAGVLTFHNRYHDADTPIRAAFTDAAGTTYPYAEAVYEYDDSRLYNDITVARENGTTIRVTDTSVIGVSNGVSGLLYENDDESRSLANALLFAHKTARRRIRALMFKPRSAPATLFAFLRYYDTPGTRITFRRAPLGGTAWTQALTIEGIQHRISAADWAVTYLTAPTDVTDGWWVLGDTTLGILGTARVGY